MFKWVDRDGFVHFSDHIPENAEGLKVDVQEVDTRDKPFHKNPIKYSADCTFTIKGAKNLGTGFFISSNGYAITCKHVIEEGPSHIAVLKDRNEFPIGIISTSDTYDLALILVLTPPKTPYMPLRDPSTMTPGDRVFAIGNSISLQAKVTEGIFNGLRRELQTDGKLIQFSAPINPGNSGGPLIDKKGNVIGVISWKIISNRGIPINGVGFAIPSGYLIEEYSDYIE